MRFFAASRIVFFLTLAACASVVSDDRTTTLVQSDPEGAVCELVGQGWYRLVRTPEAVTLPAKAAPIAVICSTFGRRTGVEELDTRPDGWTLGNLLLMSPVGLMIDGLRGAGMDYDPAVMVDLDRGGWVPQFRRQAWFDRLERDLDERWESRLAGIHKMCASTAALDGLPEDDCDAQVARALRLRAREREDLAAWRREGS